MSWRGLRMMHHPRRIEAPSSSVLWSSHFPLSAICAIRGTKGTPVPERPLHASGRGGGSAMTFEEILDHAMAMLQRRGRVTYRTLKRQFQLDDAALEDLTVELIKGQRLAVDED